VDIEFVVGDAGLRRWHSRLAEYLVELPGVALWTTLAPGRPRFCTVDLLYRLEGLIYGVAPGHPAEPVGAMPGRPMDRGRRDLVVDLSGADGGEAVPVLRCARIEALDAFGPRSATAIASRRLRVR
jgi:hypothetical protein